MTPDVREFSDQRVAMAKQRLGTPLDIGRFAGGLIVIVLGALMMAEGVAGWVTNTSFMFAGVSRPFEFVVGLIALIVGASMIPQRRV